MPNLPARRKTRSIPGKKTGPRKNGNIKPPSIKPEGGRPSSEEAGLTAEQQQFAFHVSRGLSYVDAAIEIGIAYKTALKWRKLKHVQDEISRQSEMLVRELITQATGSSQAVFEELFAKGMDSKDKDQFKALAKLWDTISPTFLQRLSPAEAHQKSVDAPSEETVEVGDEAADILASLGIVSDEEAERQMQAAGNSEEQIAEDAINLQEALSDEFGEDDDGVWAPDDEEMGEQVEDEW